MKHDTAKWIFLLLAAGAFTLAGGTPQTLKIDCERDSREYRKGETARFFLDVKDEEGKSVAGSRIKCVIRTETGRKEQFLTSGNEPVSLEVTQNIPGSCSFEAEVLDEKGKCLKNKLNKLVRNGSGAAFSLEELVQGYPEEADFETFWQAKKKELAAVPMKVEYKDVDLKKWANGGLKSFEGKIVVKDVKISCSGKLPVTGYFAMPAKAAEKTLPIVIVYQPYGVRSSSVQAKYAQKCLVLDVNANGLENGREASFYRELANGPLKHYFFFGNKDRETSYFKDMYLRALRALEFMKSRPEWNGKDVIVTGYSQGGAQALAVAGLDESVTIVAATCPALCDLGGALAGRRSGWIMPSEAWRKKDGKLTENGMKIIRTASYVDNANFAKRIKAEVYFSSGDYDTVCPMASVYVAYKNVPGKKSFTILKNAGHWAMNPEGEKRIWSIIDSCAAGGKK